MTSCTIAVSMWLDRQLLPNLWLLKRTHGKRTVSSGWSEELDISLIYVSSLIFWIYEWGNRPGTVLRLKSYCSWMLFFFSIFGCTGSSLLHVGFPWLLPAVATLVAVLRLLIILTHCRTRPLGSAGFSSCGTGAWLLRGMCILPWLGIEPMSPAQAGRFLTTDPPGKSSWVHFNVHKWASCPRLRYIYSSTLSLLALRLRSGDKEEDVNTKYFQDQANWNWVRKTATGSTKWIIASFLRDMI